MKRPPGYEKQDCVLWGVEVFLLVTNQLRIPKVTSLMLYFLVFIVYYVGETQTRFSCVE